MGHPRNCLSGIQGRRREAHFQLTMDFGLRIFDFKDYQSAIKNSPTPFLYNARSLRSFPIEDCRLTISDFPSPIFSRTPSPDSRTPIFSPHLPFVFFNKLFIFNQILITRMHRNSDESLSVCRDRKEVAESLGRQSFP